MEYFVVFSLLLDVDLNNMSARVSNDFFRYFARPFHSFQRREGK